MIEVNFLSGENEITTEALTQWNKGQTLSSIVCSKYSADSLQVHFHNKARDEAIVRIATYKGTGTGNDNYSVAFREQSDRVK